MSVQKFLDKIKNGRYGADITDAIIGGIKKCYDDASVNHDNANMEVKMARGTHNTLNDRLDNVDEIQAQTNAQLSEAKNALNQISTQWANICEFGAVSGGDKTVNAIALQTAIKTGKSVLIPSGSFLLDNDYQFELNDNTSILCVGKLVLLNTRTKPLFTITEKSNINLKLNTFMDVGSDQTYSDSSHIVLIRSGANIIIENSIIDGSLGDAIYVGRNMTGDNSTHSKNIKVMGNVINKTKRNGIAIVDCEDGLFSNNSITSPTTGVWNVSCSIDIEPNNGYDSLKKIKIQGNTINTINGSGEKSTESIRCLIGSGKRPSSVKDIFIENNIIECNNNPNYGIAFSGDTIANNININNNSINNPCKVGIQAYKVAKILKVEGNVIESSSSKGIVISYSNDVIHLNKNIVNITGGYGLHVYSNSGKYYEISGNNIGGEGSSSNPAIMVDGNEYETTDIIVKNNSVSSTSTVSVRIFKTKDTLFTENLLSESVMKTYNENLIDYLNKTNGVMPSLGTIG